VDVAHQRLILAEINVMLRDVRIRRDAHKSMDISFPSISGTKSNLFVSKALDRERAQVGLILCDTRGRGRALFETDAHQSMFAIGGCVVV